MIFSAPTWTILRSIRNMLEKSKFMLRSLPCRNDLYRIGHLSRRCCPTLMHSWHKITTTYSVHQFSTFCTLLISRINTSLCYTVHHSASPTIQLYPGENLWERGSATRTNSIFRLNSLWVQFTHIVVPYVCVCSEQFPWPVIFCINSRYICCLLH
jgi:hypothetical protein